MSWHGFEIARAAYGLAIIFGVAFLLGGVSWAFNAFMDWIAFRIIARHDGNHSAGACPLTKGGTRTETPVSTLTTVGGPFAVDASNGPLNVPVLTDAEQEAHRLMFLALDDWTVEETRRRMKGLTEVHKLPEGIVPPPSRSIRSSKVH